VGCLKFIWLRAENKEDLWFPNKIINIIVITLLFYLRYKLPIILSLLFLFIIKDRLHNSNVTMCLFNSK
jgi:hypothetical protein